VFDSVLDIGDRLRFGLRAVHRSDEAPFRTVDGFAVDPRFFREHVPVQRQRIKARRGGSPD